MRVLVVDDEAEMGAVLIRVLAGLGHLGEQATTAAEGLQKARNWRPEAVLLDINMPDISGLELLPDLLKAVPGLAVVMVTGQASHQTAVAAMKAGAEDYLEKPFSQDELGAILDRVAEKLDLRRQVEDLKRNRLEDLRQDTLAAEDPAMLQVYQAVAGVAAKEQVTVLIQGETGTGKEHVAKLLHLSSPRSGGPFIELHCGALPETLLESELFGFEAGAFTDARKAKPGLFEMAQKGTLFLDEIGEVPLSVQAKLLKVLEQKSLRRLGGVENIKLDVRIVSATNRDLAEEVRQGRFRADLYYRLNVFNLSLPPLRSRQQDIPKLAAFFFERACREFERRLEPLGAPVLKALQGHGWPGNVRELKNSVDRLVLQAAGPAIGLDDVAQALPLAQAQAAPRQAGGPGEAQRLLELLKRHRGDKSKAAAELGVSRPTLYRRLKQAGLFDENEPAV
ncbi:MAG TPA: sigma-54 dependent transcriptional regulator [bacterium]|nr:sigma-54 dependent transcriptional regulator [bacterium]